MSNRSSHNVFWSSLLAFLLFAISVSGSTLPQAQQVLRTTGEDAKTQTQLSASPDFKAVLKDVPKFVFSYYFGLPDTSTAHFAASFTLSQGLTDSLRSFVQKTTVQAPVRYLISCLLCSPNAP